MVQRLHPEIDHDRKIMKEKSLEWKELDRALHTDPLL